MSDTTHLHDVSARDVLDTIQADTSQVTADSGGINLGQVDKLIQRGAGQVNALLVRHGIDPEALDANSSQVARDAIISYAGAYVLERMSGDQQAIERRLREWERLLKTLKEDPQSLGSAQDGQGQRLTRSNIDTGSGRAVKRFDRKGYKW